MTVTGGKVPGVHYIDVLELRCRHVGILVAGGKVRADVDMDNGVAVLKQPGEHREIVIDVVGSGGAEVPSGGNMVKNVLRHNVYPIPEGFIPLHGVEREDFHPVRPEIVGIQVAGAVGGDSDVHGLGLPFLSNINDIISKTKGIFNVFSRFRQVERIGAGIFVKIASRDNSSGRKKLKCSKIIHTLEDGVW